MVGLRVDSNYERKTCCFTGHRDLSSSDRDLIERQLEPTLVRLIESGVCFFGAGGALGADTYFELAVLKLKHRYPHIKLILVLPCHSQTRGWKEEDIRVYEEIKSKADKVVYTSEEYTKGCMHKRNRHLVDHSGTCIAFFKRPNGGTKYTWDYAQRSGLVMINLAAGDSFR